MSHVLMFVTCKLCNQLIFPTCQYVVHIFHGRLWVFSYFLLFKMSCEVLFTWGNECVEVNSDDTILNAFASFFFPTKTMGDKWGTKKKAILKLRSD
jgi:hypothetical protein